MQNRKWRFKILCTSSQGMTLVEILIAITLLSFIGLGTVTMMDNSFQTKESVLKEDDESLQIESAMARLEWDFSQIFSPLYYSRKKVPGINGKQGISQQSDNRFGRSQRFVYENQAGHPVPRFFNPDERTFEFMTASNRRKMENSRQSDYAWVRYSLMPSAVDPDETVAKRRGLMDLVRTYSADNPYTDDDRALEEVKHYKLLTHVSRLRFRFWDPVKAKYVDSTREVQGLEHILWGLQVEVTWVNTNGVEETVTKTFRPIWPKQEIEDLAKLQAEADGGGAPVNPGGPQ